MRVSRRAARRCGARVCAAAVGGGLARAASQLPRAVTPPMVCRGSHVTDACLQIIIIRRGRGRCGAARSVALRATHSCRCIWRDSIRNEQTLARSFDLFTWSFHGVLSIATQLCYAFGRKYASLWNERFKVFDAGFLRRYFKLFVFTLQNNSEFG